MPVPDNGDTDGEGEQGIPPVLLGRSKEELLQALGKAEEQRTEAIPSKDLGTEEGAEDMVRKPVVPVVPKVTDHVEL